MADYSLQKELIRLRTINRIHQNIGTNLELEEIARIIIRELIDTLHCDTCVIALIEEDNKVTILAEHGLSDIFNENNLTISKATINQIRTDKQGIFINNITNSPEVDFIKSDGPIEALICVPIIVDSNVKGIIHMSSLQKDAFDIEDFRFTELLAREIAIAIERSSLFAQIIDISIKDGLTGCFNRRKFDSDIKVEITGAKNDRQPLSLMMMDVDWFKKYNDVHGHPKGDSLLKKLVTTTKSNIRPTDRIYRYGGEEFTILLPNTNREGAVFTAIRLQNVIDKVHFEGEEISQPYKKITVSVGIASFPEDARNSSGLTGAADGALLKAKETGRNKVCVFEKE